MVLYMDFLFYPTLKVTKKIMKNKIDYYERRDRSAKGLLS